MPEAGSVTIKLSVRNRPRVSCCQSVTQPKTTLESCRGHDTRLNVVKNRSFLRLVLLHRPVTFTCSLRLYWMMRQGWDYQQWNEFGSHKAAGLYISRP